MQIVVYEFVCEKIKRKYLSCVLYFLRNFWKLRENDRYRSRTGQNWDSFPLSGTYRTFVKDFHQGCADQNYYPASRNFNLTVTIRAGHFWPKRSKIDFGGTKHSWILKIPLMTPTKIKFCIFWCCQQKPEMQFSKFCAPEMGRKLIFLLTWRMFVW